MCGPTHCASYCAPCQPRDQVDDLSDDSDQVPNPLTLNPTPYTLHPAPCTLHPAPYTLHPALYTLHPAPYTLHPAPCTLHPKPYTLNTKPGAGARLHERVLGAHAADGAGALRLRTRGGRLQRRGRGHVVS